MSVKPCPIRPLTSLSISSAIVFVPFLIKIHQAPYDFCRYTHFKLQRMLDQAGFREISIQKLGTALEVMGSLKWHIYHVMAPRHTRSSWWLQQLLRVEYHVTQLIVKWLLRDVTDLQWTEQDYFVGYGCVACK